MTRPISAGFDPQKLEVPLGANQLPTGDDRALFLLSQGRCYAPDCAVRAFQKVDGHFKPLLRRAHICAHDPGGPRYDPAMTPEVRDSWMNMLLLCDEHHGKVDSKKHLPDFPVALLLQWKSDREAGQVGDPQRLRGISDLDFQQLLVDHVEGVMHSIDQLKGVSQAVIDEIKGLVEHRFTKPTVDSDAIESLAQAVMTLRRMGFGDNVTDLYSATQDLKRMGFSDHVTSLRSVVTGLKPLKDLDLNWLQEISQGLDETSNRLSGQIDTLRARTESLLDADAQVAQTLAGGTQHDWIDDIRRFWPYISKTFTLGVVLGAAAIGALWAWANGAI